MRKILLALAGSALTACMPVLTHEYDVQGQGEKSVTAGCSQAAEVMLTAHPTANLAVVYWYSADRLRPNHRIVSIDLVLSDDIVVRLTKPEVRVSTRKKTIPATVPITAIRRATALLSPSCALSPDAIYQKPDEAMHRSLETSNGESATDAVFVIDVVVSGDPSEVVLQLPPILVNDTQVDLAAVTLSRKLAVTY